MQKRILYAVLDWGLGHATRSIPIIRKLLAGGSEVILASDSLALDFLRGEFPHLPYYSLPSYSVQYNSDRLFVNALKNFGRVTAAIRREHAALEEILIRERITAIVSDNRYGCYHREIPSAIITHQLKFTTGSALMDRVAQKMVRQWNQPFDRIWIPDDPTRTLSGHLSESEDQRVRCIGWQSTLTNSELTEVYQVAAVISGPEPQRTRLEKEVRQQLRELNMKCALVRGVKGMNEPRQSGNIAVYDYLDRSGIDRLIAQTNVIVCRTGYSSLMDLQSIGQKAILVPTPGQPEQVYLGKRLQNHPNYVVQQQGRVDIMRGFEELKLVEPETEKYAKEALLHDAISDFLAVEKTGEPV